MNLDPTILLRSDRPSDVRERSLRLLRFMRYSVLCWFLALTFSFTSARPQNTLPAETYEDDGILKVLAIGNSFSEDAIENHLYDLAKEKNQKIIIGNLYIGGASLDLHLENILKNHAAYEYRKTDVDGHKKNQLQTSVAQALLDEDWDYISVQQVSQLSGQYDRIQPALKQIIDYVKAHARHPKLKIAYHQTWAYAQTSTHDGFQHYNRDQQTMYHAIMSTTSQVRHLPYIDLVIPAGTAIQNARTSFVGDRLTRDGYHLSLGTGRYVAACTWYEALFGTSAIGYLYKPAGMTQHEALMAQHAAHEALKSPYQNTPLVNFFEELPTHSFNKPVNVAFGLHAQAEQSNTATGTQKEFGEFPVTITAGTTNNIGFEVLLPGRTSNYS